MHMGRGTFGRAPSRDMVGITGQGHTAAGEEASAVWCQLGLNVHPAYGAFPAGAQPLVHASLVEEVHAG